MRIGRLILTHRQDLLKAIKQTYLPLKTKFLVLAYNKNGVSTEGMEESVNFKLFPYVGPGANGSISAHQYRVWNNVAKAYPEIEAWVIHDYDVTIKPSDEDILSHIKPGQYATLGQPFCNWQEGMEGNSSEDVFPYISHYISSAQVKDAAFLASEKLLKQEFPVIYKNIPTVMTGYSDFIAGSRESILLFDDPKLEGFKEGGLDQVVHTILAFYGVKAVDFRKFYSMEISLDNTLYVPFHNKYDFAHTSKFWPQGSVHPGFKLALKRFIKNLITDSSYRKSFPEKFGK